MHDICISRAMSRDFCRSWESLTFTGVSEQPTITEVQFSFIFDKEVFFSFPIISKAVVGVNLCS
jgi:hypothetical protein